MSLNADIFKAYDVRGVYPSEINEDAARAIGAAFSAYLEAKRIAVGRDMRLSSPALAAAFIDGATSRGTDVVDYGMISTDMLYFAVARDGHDGGVQITYVEHAMSFIDPPVIKPFNVVLDAGSGMGGLVAPKLFERLPCRTTRLCFEIDGRFPNHEANPLIEENRRDIVERVVAEKADVGIAWDGDADRCFFIDGTGAFVSGDFITALLAEAFLIKHPGASIVYDLRASHAVKDTVARYGGTALMNRVGHAFFKRRMRETNAIFGGEVTGHYYFRDNFYADNGFIPALLMLELMSKKGQPLHDLLKPLAGRYFISGEINTKLARMDLVPARLATIAARYADGHQYELDGLSVEYPDWHFNVRPSNTEPLLRLNLEATTSQMMERKRDEVLALIRT
ncbi:MAG: phosphomannomutase/phosphoglucomutase [Gemmatimonadetes bacterium]|nr:MAG: phosphomannomutase/phosphoglucomutase [Gemmatimonadota bacterium]